MKAVAGALPLILLWGLPAGLGLVMAAGGVLDAGAWGALVAHPQVLPGLALPLWTGTAAMVLALALALLIASAFHRSPAWNRLQAWAGAGLAIPHLAFAIGFGFLIMPSGLVARLAVGGDAPPQWVTTQDPLGLSLIAALALKEVPFLLAMIWSVLSRGDAARALDGQWRAARSLGHAPGSVWLRIVLPQLLRRLVWPIVIVWVYGATVVDMALVLGPTQPPVLAVTVWKDLNDVDAANNARGLAGAVGLGVVLAVTGLLAAGLLRGGSRPLRKWLSGGPSALPLPVWPWRLLFGLVVLAHVLVAGLLIALAVTARWPWPDLWPGPWSAMAVARLADAPGPLLLSLGLGVATTLTALVLTVIWFETQAQQHDRWLLAAAIALLGLPQLVIVAGQYRLFLDASLTGTLAGLFLVHLTPVVAYVAIVLAGPYRALDRRYLAVARSLGTGAWPGWWRVTAPLLRGPLLVAAAIGFAVSLVQFVPAQLIAAGRHATLPMEAVTLSAGSNRPLLAAYAVALAVPPLLAFLLAARLGRVRWH